MIRARDEKTMEGMCRHANSFSHNKNIQMLICINPGSTNIAHSLISRVCQRHLMTIFVLLNPDSPS